MRHTTSIWYRLSLLRTPALYIRLLGLLRVRTLKPALKLASLLIRRIGNMHSDLLAKVLGDFFKRQAGGFGEEEVDDWDEEGGPADYNQVVLPADILEAHWGCLEEDEGCLSVSSLQYSGELTSKLAKEGETHADRADLCRKDF